MQAITRAIASGDPEAFARLYENRFDFVLRAVQRSARLDEGAALDVVQEAMLRVIRTIRPIQSERQLDAFLTRVARTSAYDHLRREQRRRRREAAAAQSDALAQRPSAEERAEELAALRSALGRLDRATRDIVEMRYRAGMTLEAIGARLGLKPGAVHGRLGRGVRRLRDAMERAEQENKRD